MKITQLAPSCDPLGFDIFISIEAYEDIIGSLTSAYMQMYHQEMTKDSPDIKLAEKYKIRLCEIRQTKNAFYVGDLTGRDKQFELYLKEYKTLCEMSLVNL